MSVPGKVYGKILIEKLVEVTEGKVSEEQEGFRKGRGCVDQIICNEDISGGVLIVREENILSKPRDGKGKGVL